jgi:hypothetical protein
VYVPARYVDRPRPRVVFPVERLHSVYIDVYQHLTMSVRHAQAWHSQNMPVTARNTLRQALAVHQGTQHLAASDVAVEELMQAIESGDTAVRKTIDFAVLTTPTPTAVLMEV